MIILAIETSCDETGVALLEATGGIRKPQFRVLENLVASQVKIHAPFGGVVPNLAKREHIKNLPILFNRVMGHGPWAMSKVDLICVTVGPGLEPALWTGIGFAGELGKKYTIPVIGANHLEGHLYSFLLPRKQKAVHLKSKISNLKNGLKIENWKLIFPAVSLLVSGGHTILLLMQSLARWKKLGETRDDAVGEAFDKVARLLGFPYPGGPEIEDAAKRGRADAINFPRPMMRDKNYDFSFSGLKTAVLYRRREHPKEKIADAAASFQKAAIDVLVYKTIRAAKEFGARSVILSGGVAANKSLRRSLTKETRKNSLGFFAPDPAYNLDNAAMIGAAGYFAFLRKKRYKLSARGDLGI